MRFREVPWLPQEGCLAGINEIGKYYRIDEGKTAPTRIVGDSERGAGPQSGRNLNRIRRSQSTASSQSPGTPPYGRTHGYKRTAS